MPATKKYSLVVSKGDTYPISVTLQFNDNPYDLTNVDSVVLEVWDLAYANKLFEIIGEIDDAPGGQVDFRPAGDAITQAAGKYSFKIKVRAPSYILTHTRGDYRIQP